ncbi:four helix bundle protein [Azonexus sp. IMCC34842]|uniref:four helix bundle protein n=1 Tax=Azonexus sp. IMCC34842 TaxID=3420950 RepID=UPI003D0BCB43
MRYRDLIVWQKAMDLVVEIYRLSQTFPATEKFGLASQIQRAAVSIPSNIAEGHARKSSGAFINHLSIAAGSLAEVETQLMLAERLGYCAQDLSLTLLASSDEIGRMLTGLKSSLTKN